MKKSKGLKQQNSVYIKKSDLFLHDINIPEGGETMKIGYKEQKILKKINKKLFK